MPRRRIEIDIAPAFRASVPRTWLRAVALRALDVAAPNCALTLSLAVADDDTVRDLNRRYRGLDEVTDVLSFSPEHSGEWEGEEAKAPPTAGDSTFVLPPDTGELLGDVVVSYPQAARQAQAAGHPVERELALLVAHGVLHLAGHDHAEPEDEARMNALQEQALERVFPVGRP